MTSGRRRLRAPAGARYSHLQIEALELRDLPSGLSAAPAYGQIPLSFEANQGQTDGRVQYLAHGPGYTLFLTPSAATLELAHPTSQAGTVLDMQLVGAQPDAPAQGLDEQGGTANYFIGNDPGRWHPNVATFGRVQYAGVYAGINLVYYGNQQQLEYDFDVAPGANPGAITLTFPGASGMDLDPSGALVLHTPGGDVVQHAPIVYQDGPPGRQSVAGRYVLEGGGRVGFALGSYDPTRTLVIDPTLSYSTYLGGNGVDEGRAIAVDAAGNAYITGYTTSTNFPTTPGAVQTNTAGNGDAFVAKLNATGTALVYATYLGGSGLDQGWAITVNAAGNAFVTGDTASPNFPTTRNAFQPHLGGGLDNAFVTELNATGTALVYSTYLGGSRDDHGRGIALDSTGRANVTGYTTSSDFPTTAGAFQTVKAGATNAFVTRLNVSGTGLVYSTYLGGGGNDYGYAITIGRAGDDFVTGSTTSPNFPVTDGVFQATLDGGADVFVAKLNLMGTALIYSTYLGGSGDDEATAIAVDASGRAYVAGDTNSTDFPTTRRPIQGQLRGGYDAFVLELNPAATALIYSTYLGGSGDDEATGIAVDGAGTAYVVGDTLSGNFPVTADAFQSANRGREDVFLAEVAPTATALAYSTYLGGSADDFGSGIALDGVGGVYVVGYTSSSDFPTTPDALQTRRASAPDAFVAKFAMADPATRLQVTISDPNPTAGTPVMLTVTALDAAGLPATGYRGTVHFASDDAAATLPADYTFTDSDQGSYTVDGVVFRTAGSWTVTAADTVSDTLNGSADLTVAPAAAASLRVTTGAASLIAGHTVRVTVTALDPYGNVATGFVGRVVFTDSDPQATLPAGFTFQAANNGVHTFTATQRTAGSQTISAADNAHRLVPGAATVTVRSAPLSMFLVADVPTLATAGQAVTFTVTAQDPFGNTITSYRGTVHLSSTDPHAVLDPDYTFTMRDAGRATFHATLFGAGIQVVSVVDTANADITGSSGGIAVIPAAADHLQVQAPARVYAGLPFTVTLAALDPYGNVDFQYLGQVSWSTTDPDAGVRLPPPYTFTPADAGVRRFVNGVTLVTAGFQALTARDADSGLSGTATVTVGAGVGVGGRMRGAGQLVQGDGPPVSKVAPMTRTGDGPPVKDSSTAGFPGWADRRALGGASDWPVMPASAGTLGRLRALDQVWRDLDLPPLVVGFSDELRLRAAITWSIRGVSQA